ncbi:thymidylate kinase [Theileria orientalis]|uniref:Thymidylate kinase n=1 Tax=Theileria orientalis TaxID=68886 RepID=A0A976QXA0_THEOR|nr:thymidylate kinase [Theileria orientalis]
MRRGKFIVFEGIDRSGKSTQIKLLSQKLVEENIKTQIITFPNKKTPIGRILGDYLRSRDENIPKQALHLLFSANRWEVMDNIKKVLESGTHVITDRYAYSGISYSVGAEGLNFDWCKIPDKGLIQPDVVFYMDIEPEQTTSRGDFGVEIYENIEHLKSVHQAFKKFTHLPYWNNIQAFGDKNVIHEKIYSIARTVIEREDEGLKRLSFQADPI